MSDKKSRNEAVIKIACVQMHPKVGEIDSNVKKSLTMIEEASKKGANLIVLPELANSGYVFNSREEAFKLSEEIPGGKTTKAWMDSAKKKQRLYCSWY